MTVLEKSEVRDERLDINFGDVNHVGDSELRHHGGVETAPP